jgi:hypothetical protein
MSVTLPRSGALVKRHAKQLPFIANPYPESMVAE